MIVGQFSHVEINYPALVINTFGISGQYKKSNPKIDKKVLLINSKIACSIKPGLLNTI